MENNEIKKKTNQLVEFKKTNEDLLITWSNKIKEIKKDLFDVYCLKKYLNECEPSYCSFRITGQCKYLEELSAFEELIKLT